MGQPQRLRVLFMKCLWPELSCVPGPLPPRVPLTSRSFLTTAEAFETLMSEEMGRHACLHLQHKITSQTRKNQTLSHPCCQLDVKGY